jgi:predicted PurR-regulated permease PerM
MTLALFAFLFAIKSILLPFVLGILTAYFLDPAADRLERLKLSRTTATSIITACFFITVGLLCLLIVPLIGEQFSGLLSSLPGYAAQFEQEIAPEIQAFIGMLPADQMDRAKEAVANFSGVMVKWLTDVAGNLFASGMAFINLLSLMLITPLVTFYLLRDWDKVVSHVDNLLPRKHEHTIREQLVIIDNTLAGFIRGQLNVCFILAAFYAIGLSVVGLKFGIVIGLITGLLAIVPYLGFALGFITGMAVAFFQFGDFGAMIAVLVVFMIGQVLESYILTPKLVGEKVGLHPVWIIFAMLAGGALFGFVGVLLAIPVAAILGVLLRFGTERYLESRYYHG